MSPWSISSSFEINFNLTTFCCLLMLVVNGHKKYTSQDLTLRLSAGILLWIYYPSNNLYGMCGDGSTISANKCEKPQKQSSNFFLPPQVKFVVMWIIKTVLLFFSGCWFSFFYVCFVFLWFFLYLFRTTMPLFLMLRILISTSRINDIKNYFYWDFPFVFLLPCHAKTKSAQKLMLYICADDGCCWWHIWYRFYALFFQRTTEEQGVGKWAQKWRKGRRTFDTLWWRNFLFIFEQLTSKRHFRNNLNSGFVGTPPPPSPMEEWWWR